MKTKRDRFNLFGKRWFMLLLSFMVSAASFAMSDQSPAAVRGRVIDSNGEALIGVSVLVRGTQKGTITDSGGNFLFRVYLSALFWNSVISVLSRLIRSLMVRR